MGVPSPLDVAKANVDIGVLDRTMIELPGVREGQHVRTE